jgi:hypothetical protein
MGDLFEQPGQRAAKGSFAVSDTVPAVANSRAGIGNGGSVGPTGGVAAGVLVSLVVRFACVG